MKVAYKEHYTAENYQEWEGDWELIYGEPYAMSPSPLYDHQHINLKNNFS